MEITPDQIVYVQWGAVALNATVVWTWVVMALLVAGSWALTRAMETSDTPSRGQHVIEAIVALILGQIRDVSGRSPETLLPFAGTLFLFIVTSNSLTIVPGFHAPTSSLSTTTALALCVFIAVPVFGIREQGLRGYLRHYAQPSVFMVPLTFIGEVSRTVALALRLFGNMMSGVVMAAVFVGLAPLFFPAVLQAFGLVIGVIQAYIFSVLATVYIASATQVHTGAADTREGT
ncbi:MAG: F0F1 ATP synthase subunit A [Acidobacteria bacterium]|nr:F0F1 ATP synthase subunit A [Acidobacteriota bacterium]